MSGFFSFLSALWPSKLNTKAKILSWRYAVAVSLMLLFFSMGFAYAFSLGFIPGFAGFAMAEGQQQVSSQIANLQRDTLADRLLKMRERQCRAIKEQNTSAMGFAASSMQELRGQYRSVAGENWETPDCEELI